MEFDYEITKDDFLAFNLHYAKHSETIKKALFKQHFIAPVIFLILPFIVFWITGEFLIEVSIGCMLAAIVWLTFYPKYFYSHIKRNVSKVLNEGSSNHPLGKHRMIMNEESLTEKSKVGETTVDWAGIEKVEENEDYYFLFFSAMQAYIIPKQCLAEKTDQAEFRQLLRKKGFRV